MYGQNRSQYNSFYSKMFFALLNFSANLVVAAHSPKKSIDDCSFPCNKEEQSYQMSEQLGFCYLCMLCCKRMMHNLAQNLATIDSFVITHFKIPGKNV